MSERTFSTSLPNMGRSLSWAKQPDIYPGEIARSEVNLLSLPFTRPSPPAPGADVSYQWTAEDRKGNQRDFYRKFSPGEDMKLPGPTADRVMMALMSVPPTEKENGRFEVETCVGELAGLCGLGHGGSDNRRIRKALRRLKGLTITTNAFWHAGKEEYFGTSNLELFSSLRFTETGTSKKIIKVQWSSGIAEVMGTWTKPTALKPVLDIGSCIARKLYRTGALGIYQEGELVEDLEILAYGYLGMKKQDYASELKHALAAPAETLQKKELASVAVEKAEEDPAFGSGWRVRVRPMSKMHQTRSGIQDPQYWACQLARRDVMDLKENPLKKCRELVDENGVDRVRSVLKEYDERTDGGGSSSDPVRHPGWIVDRLRHDPSEQKRSAQSNSSTHFHY
mgnify:CR=1 FL=1